MMEWVLRLGAEECITLPMQVDTGFIVGGLEQSQLLDCVRVEQP